ncbi:hypothetical protein OMP06_19161 (plasmid) [Acinetobacter baumannii]|nr:hypothetical protein OMP06_19161 [Acinetobacter baumannii]
MARTTMMQVFPTLFTSYIHRYLLEVTSSYLVGSLMKLTLSLTDGLCGVLELV